jgi:DNA-binding transcriptional LysR family regulator
MDKGNILGFSDSNEQPARAQDQFNAVGAELPAGELIQYWCAVAVGEVLHFTRAAKRLRLDQSAVSRHIQKLEAKLGFKLFERGVRGVELTGAGARFLPYARKALVAAGQGERLAQAVARGTPLELDVAYSPFVDMHLIAQIRKLIGGSLLSAPVRFESVASERLIGRLLDGRSQAAIGILPVEEDVSKVCILREGLFAAIPAGHRLAQQPVIQPASLADDQVIWVFGSRESAASRHLLGLFQRLGYLPQIVEEVQSANEAFGLVREGFGVALVKASELQLHPEGILLCPFAEPELAVETGLMYLPEHRWTFLQEFVSLVGGYLHCGEPALSDQRSGPAESREA